MYKVFCKRSIICAALLLTAWTDLTAQENLDIYLCIGQSNMAGRGTVPSDATDDMEGVYLLNAEGEFEVARNPLNRYSTVRKQLANQRMSIAWGFAKAMHEQAGQQVGLVLNARGETGISQWQKGTSISFSYEALDGSTTTVTRSLYSEAVARTREAMKHGTLRGIIWHQGEYDCKTTDFTQYRAQLTKLISDLRTDLGNDTLPVVVGQISRWNWTGTEAGTEPFNAFIQTAPTFISYSACATSEDLTPWLSSGNDPHFSGSAQKTFGQRYAARMMALQQGTEGGEVDNPSPGDEVETSYIDLTTDMFHVWDGVGADAQPTNGSPYVALNLDKEMSAGGVIYGNSNVRSLQYADLTGYESLVMEGVAGGTLRVLMNRVSDNGSVTEVKATLNDEGHAEVLLTGYDFVHLNCIKVANGSKATVTKLQVGKQGVTTGVGELRTTPSAVGCYNLAGQHVSEDHKGLYIKNGRKVMVR